MLVLGGGDASALREVLRYADVEEVTLVDLDPAITRLARTYGPLLELNDHALGAPARSRYQHSYAHTTRTRRSGALCGRFEDGDTLHVVRHREHVEPEQVKENRRSTACRP
ncbi:hypothetical protein GCM10010327_26080 [Streptomyces nitrosporeus]|nr:hypothetical protein GCM10010327_26080 [Streptomyces nitrosporeus]